MDKDSFGTLALIGFLLALILLAVRVKKDQELVAIRPDYSTVVAQVLGAVNQEKSTDATAAACPQTCASPVAAEPVVEKEILAANPTVSISNTLSEKFAKQISRGELEQVNFTNDQLWWRSPEENYRILVSGASVAGFQVPTTAKAATLAPSKENEAHPAATHPLLKKVIKTISKEMSSLGYKKSKFSQCPVSEAYDPFDNCVATYTHKNGQKCSLIAGYGRLDRQLSETPYLRLELACSDQYEQAYQQVQPYLYTLRAINPEWRVPDMAVYQVETSGIWSRVSFGSNYGIFQKIDNGYKLVTGGATLPGCLLVQSNNIPQEIYRECR
ncbi:MAG: hypothetical protein Q4G02_01510 [bacterium]|nr:hypothetical protein [bacterium]